VSKPNLVFLLLIFIYIHKDKQKHFTYHTHIQKCLIYETSFFKPLK
jgi:hypothetical protein